MAGEAEAIEADAGEAESDEAILADVFPGQFEAPEPSDVVASPEPKGKTSGKAGKQEGARKAGGKPLAGREAGKEARAGSTAEGEEKAPSTGADAAEPSRSEQLARVDDDALFDEKALARPDGIKAARQAVIDARKAAQDEKRETHRVFVRVQRREDAAKARDADLNRREAVFGAQVQRLSADLDTMKNGNADEALQALGRLRGVSGTEAYEQFTQTVIANGKKAPVQRDPELVALLQRQQQQIAALTQSHQQENEGRAREAWRSGITQAVQGDEYPALNAAFKDFGRDLIDRMNEVKLAYWNENKQVLDDGALLRHFENKLAGYVSRRSATVEPQVETVSRAATSAGDRRVPRRQLPGQTVSPTRAATSAATRELTDEERYEELVNEPGILQKLGLAR